MARKGPKPPRGLYFIPVTINGNQTQLRYCKASATHAEWQGYENVFEWLIENASEALERWLWFGLIAENPELKIEQVRMDLLLDEIEGAAKAVEKAQTLHLAKFTEMAESLGKPIPEVENST